MNERRRARRRTIPFLRGGVLQVGARSHIVTVLNLSPEGAFLATRRDIPVNEPLSLRTVLPRTGRQVTLPCELVWSSKRFDPATGRPAGMAVRFIPDDPAVREHLKTFATEGPFAAPAASAIERYEYRLIEVPDLEADELNRLGRDGWRLVATVPQRAGLRLVLMRRL